MCVLVALLPRIRLTLASIAALAVGLIGVSAATPAESPAVLCALKPGQATLPPEGCRDLPSTSSTIPMSGSPRRSSGAPQTGSCAASAGPPVVGATSRQLQRAGSTLISRHAHRETTPSATSTPNIADKRILDPRRPASLIDETEPGRRPRLVGVMFSVPRRVLGPTPGGALTRWHSHIVCVRGTKRGRTSRPDGSCPSGASKSRGSEMLYIWFTHDLRSVFAVHAPVPELCRDGLLTKKACRAGLYVRGM